MIYSCFDQGSGAYRYFEDEKQIPVNGDLPVPNWLKGRSIQGIGVPSLEAGRPMPADAKFIGMGPNARGVVANCQSSGRSLGELSADQKQYLIAGSAVAVGAYLWLSDQKLPAAAVGAIGLAAFFL